MRRRVVILLLVLAAVLFAPATPAAAALGDAKIVVYDMTLSTTICTSTTGAPSCADVRLLVGHRYRMTVTEAGGNTFKRARIELPGTSFPSDPAWTYNTGYFSGSGGDGCSSQVTNPTIWTCWGSTNWASSLTLEATALSVSNGIGKIEVERVGVATKTAQFNYRPEWGFTRVYTCAGVQVSNDAGGDLILAKNTCYKWVMTSHSGQATDAMYFQLLNANYPWPYWSSVTFTQVIGSGVTCGIWDNLLPRFRYCAGSNGARHVTSITVQGTSCNCVASGSSYGWVEFNDSGVTPYHPSYSIHWFIQ